MAIFGDFCSGKCSKHLGSPFIQFILIFVYLSLSLSFYTLAMFLK